MVHLWRRIFIGILLLFHKGLLESTAIDIEEITKAPELIKNEGDALEIECYGFEKISFIYPNVSNGALTVSDAYVTEGQFPNGTHKYLFQRPETVYGDTGLYGCPNHLLQVTSDPQFTTEGSFVYIYFQSNTSLFVEANTFSSLRKIIGETAVISCRPTSPDLRVNLDSGETNIDQNRLSFNPRIGYTLSNLTIKDSGYFNCKIERDGVIGEVNYHLLVDRYQPLNEPKIQESTLDYVTRGQTLFVNCTTEVNADLQYVFNWSTPQQDSRITSRYYRKIYGANILRATNELIIRNMTDEDEGWYECSIMSLYDSKRTRKYIQVHDPEYKFINLTAQDADRYYQRQEGDKVQWVVYVQAYPEATLKWLDPRGDEIVDKMNNYVISYSPTKTILKINTLKISNMGIYSLQATNGDRNEMLNFTLDVIVKPILMLEESHYYSLNQEAKILCDIVAFPLPNISWSFTRCPEYPTCEDKSTILTDTKETLTDTRFYSKVKMIFEMTGQLKCTACNILGCESSIQNALVSDGRGGFGIIEPKELVTVGDDLELICAASVYNYSDNFDWRYGNDTRIVENNRLSIIHSRTQFTHRSILKIKNVNKGDSTNYSCINKEEISYFLQVHDARAPTFKETNMNKNELTVDLNTDAHKTVILKCFADGMPRPNITWYKDDTLIKNNDQYMLLYHHQELHIKYLLGSDSGKYSCLVENRIGKIEASQLITIKGKVIPKELIILIGVLAITVVILIVYFTIKIRREKIMRKELMEAGLMHFEEGAIECLNPDMTVDDQAELLPYDKKWEFPRERLKLGKKLGSGAFGVVMKAEAQGICEHETITTVAVKMVRRTTDPTYVRALASELKIMVHLGKHLNVVNLLGACTKNISKRELLVIVEYCRFGNLHNYLLRHRADFINQIDPATEKIDPNIGIDILTRSASIESNYRIKYAALSFSRSLSANSGTDSVHYQATAPMDSQGVSMSPDGCIVSNESSQPGWRSNYRGDYKDHNLKPICTQDLLSWAFQVARGMEYLSQRKVLHGDLAARNILLAENNVVKICDFGLAKTMYKDNNYKKKGDGPLPIKWMAIESIRDRIFSTQSDIWSFGIVLWEFFTLAETPYPGMEAEKLYQKLIEGYRMEQPEYATPDIYNIMLQCWKAKPTLRPSFTELVHSIGELLEESIKAHYISLNAPYLDMNTMMLEAGKNDYLTMLSAPDHETLSSPSHEYANSPLNSPASTYLCMSPAIRKDESGIFSPRPHEERTHFEFPSHTSDSEDAVELSPMLKKQEEDDDPYLKPINVHERRAEFARQRQAMKNQSNDRPIDRDSGYCNTPRNVHLIDLNEKNQKHSEVVDNDERTDANSKDFVPAIIRTQDNYVNMPKQKIDLRKDVPDGFSNPSYVMIDTRETNLEERC
ncbi:PDGF- and VEGF-receptor related isoform X1 [Osmia lignaria lignaria]|uniref:PDGF- and VEGF-receptor related isoform X1 n=1 Tax=Osmia lignaria lignaria TaxID=1437193 RepID=UPI00402B8A75